MKQFLKNLVLSLLHLIRKIISVMLDHAIPPSPHDPHNSHDELRDLYYHYRKDELRDSYYHYRKDELRDSYNHFKKYFHDAIFLEPGRIREYAINEAMQNHKPGYYYIEFGVWTGSSINMFSEILKDIKIYGFDSFEGLKEDWKGHSLPKKQFNLNKQIPCLNDNCVPVIGWIQDTLPKFISEHKDLDINFVHIDTDTYPTARFILQQIKPYLINDAIIMFDELYD